MSLLEVPEKKVECSIWRRLESGYRIEKLKPKYYEEVLDMTENYFLTEDVLFRNSTISKDATSRKSWRERILLNLDEGCSLLLIDEKRPCQGIRKEALHCICEDKNAGEKKENLAGVLILKTQRKHDLGLVYSKTHLTEGDPYRSIIHFLNALYKKVDLFIQFECTSYLRYYLLCVKPEHRGKKLGFQLMEVGIEVARSLHIPVIMGFFGSASLQKLARWCFMEKLYEIPYHEWIAEDKQLEFKDPGAGSYSCAFMAGIVPPIPEPEPEFYKEDTKDGNAKKGKQNKNDKKGKKNKKKK